MKHQKSGQDNPNDCIIYIIYHHLQLSETVICVSVYVSVLIFFGMLTTRYQVTDEKSKSILCLKPYCSKFNWDCSLLLQLPVY